MAIHPLQVFGKGFAQWKKNLWAYAGIMALLYIPLIVVVVLGSLVAAALAKQVAASLTVFTIVIIVFIVVLITVPVAVLLASIKSRQEKPKILASIAEAFRHFLRVFFTNMLTILCLFGVAVVAAGLGFLIGNTVFKASNIAGGILIGLDILVGVCALVFFGIRLSMGVYACVLEKKGPLASLHRSGALVKKHFFPVAGVYLLFAGLMLAVRIPGFVFAAVAPAPGKVFHAVILIAAELFVAPLFINTALVLWDELKAAEAK